MTRVVDKRNVCIVAKANGSYESKFSLLKRGEIGKTIYGGGESFIIEYSTFPFEHLTTPDKLIVVNTSVAEGNAVAKAFFNGVEVPASELDIGGDTYKVWGLKSQDFVVLDFSGFTA